MALIDDMFDVEGLVEQRKQLDALLMSNQAMEKKVQALIRKVLQQARKSLSESTINGKRILIASVGIFPSCPPHLQRNNSPLS